jgi:anti-sigma factor RsiW
MTCERVLELLSDYLDGELSPAAMAGVQSHLRRCHGCEQEHRALRQTVQLLAVHGRQTIPIDCREQVLARLREAPASRWRREVGGFGSGLLGWVQSLASGAPPPSGYPEIRRRPLWAGALAAAAVAMAGIGGSSLLARKPPVPISAPRTARLDPLRMPATVGFRDDYTRLHGPSQFGQALGADDGIILASDLVESP